MNVLNSVIVGLLIDDTVLGSLSILVSNKLSTNSNLSDNHVLCMLDHLDICVYVRC